MASTHFKKAPVAKINKMNAVMSSLLQYIFWVKMSNFARLFENMDSFKRAKKELEDSLSLDAIKIGMNLDENFWKNFILLLNNPDALAKLLDVPSHKITTWYSKINKYLNKYMDSVDFDNENKAKKKKRLIKTADYEDFV